MLICFNASFTEIFDNDHLNYQIFLSYLLDKEHCVYISIEKLVRYLVLNQWYEPRDVRVKVKSSKGNPGSTDLISDRLCDMV